MPVFEIGNKAAEIWTESESIEAFEAMLSNAQEDKTILCYNDACNSIKMRYTTAEYLCKKHPVLDDYKKNVQMTIISRINRGALLGELVSTPSIWRMKQCGETDEQKINHQNDGGKFEQPRIVFKKSYE